MDILALIITIALGVAAGVFVAKRAGRSGKGAVTRWAAGLAVGIAVWFATFAAALDYVGPETTIAGDPMPETRSADKATPAQGAANAPDKTEQTAQARKGTPAEPEKHLPIAIDEVEGRVNQNISEIDLLHPVRLERKPAQDDNGREVYSGTLSKHASLVVTRAKGTDYTGTMTVIMAPDGTDAASYDVMAASAVVMAIVPSVTLKETGPMITELVGKVADSGEKATLTRGDVEFVMMDAGSAGLWLIIQPLETG